MSALANWVASGRSAPILYLPLSDPTQPGKNLGTGGDFNLTGVVARSGRGPNQFNAPYSVFDGSTDWMNRTAPLVGATNSKSFTFNMSFCTTATVDTTIFAFIPPSVTGVYLYCVINRYGGMRIGAQASSYYTWFECTFYPAGGFIKGRNYNVTISCDLSDPAKRNVAVNGVPAVVSFSDYQNYEVQFADSVAHIATGGGGMHTGPLGNFFLDTKYIDLSQPDNLAKFVTGTGIDAKPADLGANGELPTGTSPLIYLPMYGNNAGKNYGTGGDFTVNSGPFTGARGPNEFWGNKANIDGGDVLQQAGISSIANSKSLAFSCFIYPTTASVARKFACMQNVSASAYRGFLLEIDASSNLRIIAYNSSGTAVLSATTTGGLVLFNGLNHLLVSVDLTNTSNRAIYINGTAATVTWTTYTNADIAYSSGYYATIGTGAGGADPFNGWISEFYFATDYIDFSQEANRLKFRDAFGNPVELQSQIDAGTLPKPAIYMRFDPANFGKNSGTGGDFTVNGTITDGGNL